MEAHCHLPASLVLVLEDDTRARVGEDSPTRVRYQEVLGGVITEYRIAFEESNRLVSDVCDCNMGNVSGCTRYLNGERASSHGQASKSRDEKDVRNHI